MVVNSKLFDRVVRTVEYNTGGPQPETIPEHTLLMILVTHIGEDLNDVHTALEAAVDDGRLEKVRHGYRLA